MNFLMSLIDRVPWFVDTLVTLVALIILWVVASFPAYLIAPLTKRIRIHIAGWIGNQKEKRQALRVKLSEHKSIATKKLTAGRSLWTPRLAGQVATARSEVNQLLEEIRGTHKRLATISFPSCNFPEVPLPDQAIRESKSIRLARLYILVGGVLLAALVVVNTGMLSQILRDLGIIPQHLSVAGIPLYYAFALLLTLVEAGIGFVFGVLHHSEPSEYPKRLKISALVILLFAIAIAFVEGFFYAQIGLQGGDVAEEFKLSEVLVFRPHQIYFVWGFVLVLMLFALGHVLVTSAQVIMSAGAVRRLLRQLEQVTLRINSLKERFGEAKNQLHSATEEAKKVADAVNAVEFAKTNPPTELVLPEIESIISRTNTWQVIAVIGLLLLLLITWVTSIPYWVGAATGVACFAVGMLLRKNDEAIRSRDRISFVATHDWIRATTAALVLTGVVALHIYLLGQLSTVIDIAGGLVSIVIYALLVGAGREISGAFAVFGASIGLFRSALFAIASAIIFAFSYVILAITWLLEFVLVLLAAPVGWFRRAGPSSGTTG